MGLQFTSLRSSERQGLQELLSLLLGECEDLHDSKNTDLGQSEFEITAADFVARIKEP